MYQNEMKEGFIKDYMRARVVAQTSLYSLFRKTQPYEETLNKDCSQFTVDDITQMYKEFAARSYYVLLNYNVILKAYCAWRQYHYKDVPFIAYDEITTDMARALVPDDAKKVLSREEVLEIEDQLYNWSDKAIVELLFEGVSGKNMEDIYAVSQECIHNNMLVVNGKRFPMTDRLRELLPKAFAETEIMSYGDTMRVAKVIGSGRIYKERANARGVDTEDAKFRFFYRKIQLFRDYLGIPGLTMKNLQAAGIVYHLRTGMETSGLSLKAYLLTEEGTALMEQYGYFSEHRVDNIIARYKQFV